MKAVQYSVQQENVPVSLTRWRLSNWDIRRFGQAGQKRNTWAQVWVCTDCLQTSRFRHPQSHQVFLAFKGLIDLMMQNLETQSSTTTTFSIISANTTMNDIRHTFPGKSTTGKECLTLNPAFVHITCLGTDLRQWLCIEIFKRVVTVIPLVEDYTCPVCATIIWKPGIPSNKIPVTDWRQSVRLSCRHVFCLQCMVRLQKARHDNCPICRKDVVLEADSCTSPFNGLADNSKFG